VNGARLTEPEALGVVIAKPVLGAAQYLALEWIVAATGSVIVIAGAVAGLVCRFDQAIDCECKTFCKTPGRTPVRFCC
jgi:hypothetical protein